MSTRPQLDDAIHVSTALVLLGFYKINEFHPSPCTLNRKLFNMHRSAQQLESLASGRDERPEQQHVK